MTINDLSVGPSIGVLIDDVLCGRMLLDCGQNIATAAAFTGISLANLSSILLTGYGPQHCDPALANAAALAHRRVGPIEVAAGVGAGPQALPLPLDGGGVAWLISTSHGVVLHHPSDERLPEDAVRLLPASFIASRPLEDSVSQQLSSFVVRAPSTTRRVLITGGARSGKSELAEQRLRSQKNVTYLASGPIPNPDDQQWRERVETHRGRRPASWQTVETSDVIAVLGDGDDPILWDCLGTWLTSVMDEVGYWDETAAAAQALRDRITGLVQAWGSCERDVVAVTNEVGSGVVPATASGRRFRDELGQLNAAIATTADEVWLATSGIGQRLK